MKTRNPSIWRNLTISLFILLAVIGLAFKTGTGTISAFGYRMIDAVCPLGGIEAMLASHSFLPRALIALLVLVVLVVLLGRFFCAWICPMPLLRSWFPSLKKDEVSAHKNIPTGTSETQTLSVTPTLSDTVDNDESGINQAKVRLDASGDIAATNIVVDTPPAASGDAGTRETNNTPYFILGGTLISSLIFGFPVFCLICPIGLTFGTIVVVWRLFGYNEPTWSLVVFPVVLVLELFVFRHWCKNFCPLGALMSLMSKLNHFLRPTLNREKCLRSSGIDCHLCTDACYEDISLHEEETSAAKERCTKCSECAASCPVHAISFPFLKKHKKITPETIIPTINSNTTVTKDAMVEISNSLTIKIKQPSKHYVTLQTIRCVRCGLCKEACPLHNEIPAWMTLLREKRLIEAVEVMHSTNSLPEICGLVCPQERLCEGACSLGKLDGAVAVGAVERYVTETALAEGWRPDLSKVKHQHKKVAVIGAGPAGLACADVLIRHGIQPIVFDRHPIIGGLLSFGIPSFKLDKVLLERRQSLFLDMGIEFRLNTEVGKDVSFASLLKDYDAVFVATGTYRSRAAGIKHEDAPGVVQALPYLAAVNRKELGIAALAQEPYLDFKGKRIIVIGGGDTAIDCLRTALRQGVRNAICLYRRDETNMPASKKEVAQARLEGVEFVFNCQPVELMLDAQGIVSGIKVQTTKLGEMDASGRQSPQAIVGSERVLNADAVIMALGFEAHSMPWLSGNGVELDHHGYIKVPKESACSQQTSVAKVYAGGDAVHGADLVVTAIADGRRAAQTIITGLV